ncbi:MAG: hypothetical protein M5U28_46505 [Sandaracinaceae bacterium]|nr:hypothetical protein [Sandaracinaceae bacterium]
MVEHGAARAVRALPPRPRRAYGQMAFSTGACDPLAGDRAPLVDRRARSSRSGTSSARPRIIQIVTFQLQQGVARESRGPQGPSLAARWRSGPSSPPILLHGTQVPRHARSLPGASPRGRAQRSGERNVWNVRARDRCASSTS